MGPLLRMVWAVTLSIGIGAVFEREWSYETEIARSGQVAEPQPGHHTVIWNISPLWLIPFFLAMFLPSLLPGSQVSFPNYSSELLILLSVYFALLLLFLPLLRRYICARACATLWVLPAILFTYVNALRHSAVQPLWIIPVPLRVVPVLTHVWLAGFCLVMLWHIASHFRFTFQAAKGAYLVEDPDVLALWEKEQVLAERKRPIQLRYAPAAVSPVTVGVFERTMWTLLPERKYSEEELTLIFRHELRHIQRRDVETKVFCAFCRAVCWFNPLVWLAVDRAAADLELSCDEMVLCGADAARRRQYAELLLDAAGDGRGFSTCLSGSAKTLRHRLKNVLSPQERSSGSLLLAVVMLALTLCCGLVAIGGSGPAGDAAGFRGLALEYVETRSGRAGEAGEAALRDYLVELPVTTLPYGDAYIQPEAAALEACYRLGGGRCLYIKLYREGYLWATGDTWYQVDAPIDWTFIERSV